MEQQQIQKLSELSEQSQPKQQWVKQPQSEKKWPEQSGVARTARISCAWSARGESHNDNHRSAQVGSLELQSIRFYSC